jgi:hypothetical protein
MKLDLEVLSKATQPQSAAKSDEPPTFTVTPVYNSETGMLTYSVPLAAVVEGAKPITDKDGKAGKSEGVFLDLAGEFIAPITVGDKTVNVRFGVSTARNSAVWYKIAAKGVIA